VRKAVRRFMPGERAEDALAAAALLGQQSVATVLTELGENVTASSMADRAAGDYQTLLAGIDAARLDCDISVKLTHLGLDLDEAACARRVRSLAERAARSHHFVWIDMEDHTYVDRTIAIYRQTVSDFRNTGICLQAYLYRTAADLDMLMPLGGGVRIVKGAYREPPAVAYPRKKDVDDNFLALAARLLSPEGKAAGVRPVFGTHDRQIIGRIKALADASSLPRYTYEFHLLFGIQSAEQLRLARDGYRVRVLISYGDQWFPWYMRRLAERPANLMFVARSLLSSRR
jgi:proline dehydrogenase